MRRLLPSVRKRKRLGVGGGTTGRFLAVANWLLSLLTNDSTTVTNATVPGVWLNETNLYGDELANSPNFEVPADWLVSQGWGVTVGSASTTSGSASTGTVYQNIGVVGDTYVITYTIDSVSGSGVQARFGSTFGTIRSSAGVYTDIGKQTVSGIVGVTQNNVNTTATISHMSIRKVNSLTLVDLPDDVPIENGARYSDTVAGGARLGSELWGTGTISTNGTDHLDGTYTLANGEYVLMTGGGLTSVVSDTLQINATSNTGADLAFRLNTADGNTVMLSGIPTEGVYPSGIDRVQIYNFSGVAQIVSLIAGKEVLPTYSFTLSDGTKVAKTTHEITTNGNVEVLDPLAMVDRVNDEVVAAGDIRRLSTTEGLDVWVIYTAGTVDSSQPTTSITNIGIPARGDELFINPTLGDGWTANPDGTYSSDGTQAGNSSLVVLTGFPTLSTFDVAVNVIDISAGIVQWVEIGGDLDNTDLTATGVYPYTLTSSDADGCNVAVDADFIGTISVTMKQVTSITDGTAEYTVQGLQTAEGLYSSLEATNELLWSRDPDNAAWTQRGTFDAVQDLVGADGVANSGWTFSGLDISGNDLLSSIATPLQTATRFEPSFLLKQIDTSGVIRVFNPQPDAEGEWIIDLSLLSSKWEQIDRKHQAVTINAEYDTGTQTSASYRMLKSTGTGTLSVGYFDSQLEKGEVSTPIVPTEATTVTRTPTVTTTPIAETKLTPEAGYGVIVARPDRAGQVSHYLNSSQSVDPHIIGVYLTPTGVVIRKLVGANYIAEKAYTHQAKETFIVIYRYDSIGIVVSADEVGGVLPLVASTATTEDITLGSTLETGSKDGQDQFQGEIIFNGTFDSWEQAVDYINTHNLADTSNL